MNTQKLGDFAKKQPIALVCAVISVIFAAAIYYRSGALPAVEDKLKDKTAEWEHIRDNVKNSEQLDEQFATLTQAIQVIESHLVHPDQLAINLQYFYKLESETQTKLTDLRQTGLADKKKVHNTAYAGVGYAVSVQGSYPLLMNFLRRIENSEYYSRVDGLTLTQAGGGRNATDLSLRLDLELLGLP